MHIFTASTYIYVHCCFLATLSFYFFKDISIVSEQPLILLLGQALQVERGFLNENDTNITQLFGVLLAMLAGTDLVQLISKNKSYFEMVVPTRLLVLFVAGALGYFTKGILHNDLVLTFIMADIWINYTLYLALREESKKHKEEEMKKMRYANNI